MTRACTWFATVALLLQSTGSAQQQWRWRIEGKIPVILPAHESAGWSRPPVRFEIIRAAPERTEPGRIAMKLRRFTPILPDGRTLGDPLCMEVLERFGVHRIEAFLQRQSSATLQDKTLAGGLENVVIVHFDPGFDPFDVAAALMDVPGVEYAVPLYIRRFLYVPNDPRYPQQQALNLIQMAAAWDITHGSTVVTIAIIDSGTDYEHEDLAATLWTNPGETGTDAQGRDKRSNSIDDDGNGKVDDWRGWDFIGSVTRSEFSGGIVREDNDPKVRSSTITSDMAHGTNVAGIAIAVTNNARGIASPAGLRCRYIPIKCGSDDQSLAGAVLRGYDAIVYAARLGARVINCSWGGPEGSPLEQQIIDQVRSLGALVVAATGNDGINLDRQPFYPALYHGVLAVGASTLSDRPASYSNFGRQVSLYCPGENTWTTQPGNTYIQATGTSFAAPLVSGVAALVRSLHPDWTIDQVIAQLRYSSDRLTGVSDAQRPLYYGRLNASRALAANLSFTNGERFPGIRIREIRVGGGTAITTTAQIPLEITLENLLAPAGSVQASLSVSSNATLGTRNLSTAGLGTLQTRVLTTTIKLGEPVYFFDGTVELQCTLTADGITDVAIVAIPINLPTPNTYTRHATGLPHDWSAVAMRGLSGIWAVGRTPMGRAVVYRSNGNVFDSTSLNGTPTSLALLSTSTALIGTNNARIWRTSDGGSTWRWADCSAFTPSPQGLVFFDASTGVCMGNPSSSSWRLGRTSDGGTTWNAAEQLPTPLSNETITHHAITAVGDTIWVGSSRGRILRSSDRGRTWVVASITPQAPVVAVSFSGGKIGYCASRGTSGQTVIYRTDDGGVTWHSTGAAFQSPNLIALYAPPRSASVYALCSGSQVLRSDDGGQGWEPVLTGYGGSTAAAFGTTSGQNVSLTLAGTTVALLRTQLPAQLEPRLSIIPADTLQCGIVPLDSQKIATLTISNIGTAPLRIDSVRIEPLNAQPDEYTAVVSTPLSLNPNQSRSVEVLFKPRQSGQRRSLMSISTNAGTALIILSGAGTSTLSVQQLKEECLSVINNRISLNCPSGEHIGIEVWMLNGQKVAQLESLGNNRELDLNALSAGTYILRIRAGAAYFCDVFLITR